jgi:hypothetical protein
MLDNRHLGSERPLGPKVDKAKRKTEQNIEESQNTANLRKRGAKHRDQSEGPIIVKEKVQPCKKTCQRAQATLDNRRDV